MFRIPSLSSRINELESDNECLRRIQYELLTPNSILTGNISDLKVEVDHFRKEAELNDDRVLQMQFERDMALEQVESLQAENTDLLDDNARLHNALREAKEKLAQLESAVIQPAPVEEPKDVRPKWAPTMDETIKFLVGNVEGLSEDEILARLTNRDSKLRKEAKELQTVGEYAEVEITRMNDTAARIQRIIDGDPYA